MNEEDQLNQNIKKLDEIKELLNEKLISIEKELIYIQGLKRQLEAIVDPHGLVKKK